MQGRSIFAEGVVVIVIAVVVVVGDWGVKARKSSPNREQGTSRCVCVCVREGCVKKRFSYVGVSIRYIYIYTHVFFLFCFFVCFSSPRCAESVLGMCLDVLGCACGLLRCAWGVLGCAWGVLGVCLVCS